MLSVAFFIVFEYHYTMCSYAMCHYAVYPCAECRYPHPVAWGSFRDSPLISATFYNIETVKSFVILYVTYLNLNANNINTFCQAESRYVNV